MDVKRPLKKLITLMFKPLIIMVYTDGWLFERTPIFYLDIRDRSGYTNLECLD